MCSFVCLGVLSASVFALYKLVPSARLDLLAQLALADAVSVFLLAWCQDAVRIAIDVKWKWWVWIRRRQIAKRAVERHLKRQAKDNLEFAWRVMCK